MLIPFLNLNRMHSSIKKEINKRFNDIDKKYNKLKNGIIFFDGEK